MLPRILCHRSMAPLLAASLAEGKLHIDIRATYPLTRAAEALAQAIKGSGSAIVLEP